MPDAPALAITGATGVIGRLTAEELARAGVPTRLLVRDPARAPQFPGASVVHALYADTAATRAALEGVETLFMVSADESEGRTAQELAFVAAAAAAGVQQIVYTSFQGAAADAVFTYARHHFATEQAIRASGMAWTMLRDSFYLDFIARLPGADGALRGPAGTGRVAAVARLDVARCAAAVLRDPAAHIGRTYELTGPEALTFTEFADTLSRASGREIRFVDETLEEARRSREPYGVPEWRLEAWISTFTAAAAGAFERVTDDVELLTGRKPLRFAELLSA